MVNSEEQDIVVENCWRDQGTVVPMKKKLFCKSVSSACEEWLIYRWMPNERR